MLKQSPPPACVHVFPGPAQAQKSSPRTGPGTRLVTRRPPNQPGGPTASLGGAPAPRGEVPGAGGLRPGRALCRRRGGRAGGGARGGRRLPAPGSRGSPPRPRPCTCDCRGARPPRPATAAPMAPSRLQLGLRAAYSGLSSVAGFSIFLVWTVVYRQPGTAAMGGLAGTPGRAAAAAAAGGKGGSGSRLRARGCGRRCQLLPEAPGGPRCPGDRGGELFTQNRPWAAQAPRGPGRRREPMPARARPGPPRPASAVCTNLPRRRRGCRVTASSPSAGFPRHPPGGPPATHTRLCRGISAPQAPLARRPGEAEEE